MTAPLDVRFRRQADQCRTHGSALTAALLEGAAGELDHGPVADLLRPLEADPAGSVPSLRFAAALHRLVLQRDAPALALHYPSVGGTAPVDQAWDVAREVVADHGEALAAHVRRPVQTNEVGRSSVLLGGLLHVAAHTRLPVRLLEVGASAGLNLRVDRFTHVVGGQVLGEADSPVRLVEPWSGALPPVGAALRVVDRVGCDPEPLDPTTTDGRLTLTSCVWADQVPRLERLRGALDVAARVPARVERLPASALLERELAAPAPGVATVVWHSVVRQYLAPDERERVVRLLEEAGGRATAEAPLAHLSMEPDRVGAGRYRFIVSLRMWPGGRNRVLGEAQGHGPPVVWA